MDNRRKGFVIFPVLLFVLFAGIVIFVFYKNSTSKNEFPDKTTASSTVNSEENKEVSQNSVVTSQPKEINNGDWITQTDSDLGFSFEVPKDWKFVKAYGGGNSEYDIKDPEKSLLVFISVHVDKRIGDSLTLSEALKERENDIKSDESYKIANFESSVGGSGARYVVSGERQYFNFQNENAWEEADFILYDLEEQGFFRSDKKVVVLQSMVPSGNPKKDVAERIIQSFKFE